MLQRTGLTPAWRVGVPAGGTMTSRKRILVVDDEPQNLELLDALLEMLGYCGILAWNGPEALAKLDPSVDLVLMDVMMPGMDGLEVTRQIRAHPSCSDVPIIMVTSLSGKADRLQATLAGANDFIAKPIDRLELRIRMASLLKMKEAQDAVKRHRSELEVTVAQRTDDLRQSNQRYRALFEDSLDPILIVDLDGEIIEANRASVTLFGYSLDEMLKMNARSLYADPSDRKPFLDALLKTGSVKDYALKARTKDGSLRDCVLTSSVYRDADGKAVGVQSVIRDITDRKRADEALRESESRSRLLIEASPIAIMIAQDGHLSHVNPALVEMFGYENAAQVVGRPIQELCATEDLPVFKDGARSVIQKRESVCWLEVKGRKHDGQSLDTSIWLRSIELQRQPALLGFLVDVSEQKALRSQLLHSQKMEALGTLAGGIAHDFNNILFAIIGFTELILEDLPEGHRDRQNLEHVLQASNRAKELVRQILAFSRQGKEERRPIQIGPIVKEALKFLRASVPTTIDIQQDIKPPLGTILGDSTHIHQVLMNLCTNAAHAMRDRGGILTVSLEQTQLTADSSSARKGCRPGSYLQLTVADTGAGIDPEHRNRIFEPYFTTKNSREGTGLGLAVVHGIVETHSGMINVESQVGKGSTFRVYFPVIPDDIEVDNEEAHSMPMGDESVLLVDDDDASVRVSQHMLESLGYNVVTAHGSIEALDRFRGDPRGFDVLLTDVTMPHMTGTQLATEVRRLQPHMPVIFCTGNSDHAAQHPSREMRDTALLVKPVTKMKMAQTVRRVLDQVGGKRDVLVS